MKNLTKSIRFRIIIACIFFALIVCIIFSLVLMRSIIINSDEQFNWYIEKELDYLSKQYHNNEYIEINKFRGVVIVSDETTAIKQLTKMLKIKDESKNMKLTDFPFKNYHFNTPTGYINYMYTYKNKSIYIMQSPIVNSKNSIFYFVDFSGFNKINNMGANITIKIYLVMLSIILILAVLIGLYIAKKVLSPLTKLSLNVDNINTNTYRNNSSEYYDDEIGFLAKKIDSFVEREKAFTRDASHELRTPIATSQAALTVAYTLIKKENPKLVKVLNRIQRANKNMTHLIESFLIMGREHSKEIKIQNFKLKDLIDKSIEKNKYLLNSKKIEYKNRIDKDLIIELNKDYLSIVIDNIIRNAFIHMQDGFLIINGTNSFISIYDSGEWFHKDTELGIGLNIVERICKEQEWKFMIKTIKNKGTEINVKF